MGRLRTFEISKKQEAVIAAYLKMRTAQQKSKDTIENEQQILRKLANHLRAKEFKDATEKDLMGFFTGVTSCTSKNQLGNVVIAFYRWHLELDKEVRPQNMKWFKHASLDDRDRQRNPDVKAHFITPEEYKKIQDTSKDKYGLWEALWETLYLSGARRSEINSMTVGDVKIHENGKVSLMLRESKTRPRETPLPAVPTKLIRWLNNHILNNPRTSAKEFIRNKPEVPLWVSLSNRRYGEPLTAESTSTEFWKILRRTDITKKLSLHCFRKTRATCMFAQRSKDGGLIYDDRMMAQFFGWKIKTVAERRAEYDLRDNGELQKQIFGSIENTVEDFDALREDRDRLEAHQQTEIEALKKQLAVVQQTLLDMAQNRP